MDKLPDQLPNLSNLSHAQKDEIIRLLFPLIAEVRRLSARVAELEARLSNPGLTGIKKSLLKSVPWRAGVF